MVENRIAIIQSTIQTAGNIPSDTKAGLLKLVAGLKSEIKIPRDDISPQLARIGIEVAKLRGTKTKG